jgi:DNA-binding response OmpR family regulator
MANAPRNVLVAGVDPAFAARLAPLLGRSSFDVDYVGNARSARDLVRVVAFDVLVLGCPAVGRSMTDLVDLIRAEDSPCRTSAVLLLAPRDRLPEVEPLLAAGLTRALPQDASDTELQEVFAALLRVAPRHSVRITARLQVQLGDDRAEVLTQTENVSANGLLVRATRVFPVGSPVRFELFLRGNSAPVTGRGVVVRHALGSGQRVTGLGIELVELSPGGDTRLRGFLEEQQARAGGGPPLAAWVKDS